MPERVVIIGGSVAGLSTALALARSGRSVTVLERHDEPLPPDPAAAFAGREHGVAQRRHSHGFLARLRSTLLERAPDVLADLLEAGARELPFCDNLPPPIEDRAPRPGDERLVALACRRTTFEWVLRRAVAREPAISVRAGAAVNGLVRADDRSAVPLVTGAALEDGTTVDGDVVLDATGRFSPLDRWLAAIGAPPLDDESSPCGLIYTTRFYVLRPDAELPTSGPIGGDLGYCKYGIFLGDNDTVSVTFGLPPDDRDLRVLLKPGPFDAAARGLQVTKPWVDPAVATPISEVAVMAGMTNARRRLRVDGAPVVRGVLAVGDAAIHTNPLYGRGCSLAVVQAFAVADALDAHGADPDALLESWEETLSTEVAPWYANSVMQDRQNQVALHAHRGEPVAPEDQPALQMGELIEHGVLAAARRDPDVHRAFLRVFNLLQLPDDLLSDHVVAGRVLDAWNARSQRPPEPPLGPPRDELLQLAGAGA